jgi:GNAT superfamily N-acetyltransferase
MLDYVVADATIREQIAREWGQIEAAHLHFDDGLTIVAVSQSEIVGFIAIVWRSLPLLMNVSEGFIDIIEDKDNHRRQGIARGLVSLAMTCARNKGVYQLRAWSSEDKVEAIPMWHALGFGLCPGSTYPRGQEVKGYLVAKVLASESEKEAE